MNWAAAGRRCGNMSRAYVHWVLRLMPLPARVIIEPWLLLPLAITWLITLIMTGYVGLSTVLAGFSLIPAAWALNNHTLMVFSTVLAFFLLFTHRGNMRKLRNGTEYRFQRMRIFSRKH